MSCYGCSKKYGLFCKEYGCPNCGYSYCAKCLKRPVAVPRHAGKVMNVCVICYDKLSKQQQQANEKVIDFESLEGTIITKADRKGGSSPNPDVLFDDNPPPDLGDVLAPISPTTKSDLSTTRPHSSTANSEIDDNLDSVLSKRLQDLKSFNNPTCSDEDIRARLSNLTGIPQKNYDKKDLLLNTDQRSDQQKMQDLLAQFVDETNIDQRVESERSTAISDIEKRLRALRDVKIDDASNVNKKETSPDTNNSSDNEQDEQTMIKNILEKYTAESRLPDPIETELAADMPRPKLTTAETEELPWCNICNEDAVYRCIGCDGELFCLQCFREVHDDEEYRAHVKENYSAPPKIVENHF